MISRYKPTLATSWLCIGDFNDILSPSDKLGGDPPDLGRLHVANRACSDCGLHRFENSTVNSFTWSNNRTQPTTVDKGFDYALVNDDWDDLWPMSMVSHLIRHQLDYSPLVFHSGTRRSDIKRDIG